ncbi:hypothetical protein [Actinocatenispora rupis]|uniref:NACHT domain-containing protein n=1 Tax=Actinocatenispora rupis TaxID=519421 RepID=A0A8J3NBY8_9ACTN|nr:hypothetical protein [Actinocatenispora rupis]GID11300.1 hypothetical protein Aru02nite_21890 [Actinocatenispora rupis]
MTDPDDPPPAGTGPERVTVHGAAAVGGGDVHVSGTYAAGRDIVIDRRSIYQTYADNRRYLSLFGLWHRGGGPQVRARVRRMLADVMRQHWIRRDDGYLPVRFTERPEAVVTPRDAVLVTTDPPRRTFPAGATLSDVRDEIGGNLLVLGAPGAGKTYQVLRLAGDLLAAAERDDSLRMPVYLHLGSWTRSSGSLLAWAAAELGRVFKVPAKFDLKQIIEAEVVLLLDGLDEVDRAHRNGCARAIDEFRDRHGDVPLVVCTRPTEYEATGVRLALDGAVLIEPPTPAETESYLEGLGSKAAGLRRMLAADPGLRRLLGSPLFVTFMVQAYGSDDGAARPPTGADGVFADYVAAMYRRPVPRSLPRFAPEQVTRWLSWLARSLRRRRTPVFHLDRLSPDWLPDRADRDRALRWERVVIAVLAFGGGWLKAALMFPVGHAKPLTVAFWLVVWPPLFAWILGSRAATLERFTAGITPGTLGRGLLAWARNPLTVLAAVGLVAGWRIGPVQVPAFTALFGQPVHVRALCAMLLTLLLPVMVFVHARWFDFTVVQPRSPGEEIRAVPRRSLLVGLAVAAVVLVHQIALGWLEAPQYGTAYMLLHPLEMVPLAVLGAAWFSGGRTYVRYRVTARILHRRGLGPARYGDFLDHATRRLLLVRDGGGYRFPHDRLRRYFATLPPESQPRS